LITLNIQEVLRKFPKQRPTLPKEYQEIYDQHFNENRNGLTKISKLSSKVESWLHKKVATTAGEGLSTLEIGGGSLNQFQFEKKMGIYDVVEPYHIIYESSPYRGFVDHFYDDISEVPQTGGCITESFQLQLLSIY